MLAKEEFEPALKILMHFNSCAFLFELGSLLRPSRVFVVMQLLTMAGMIDLFDRRWEWNAGKFAFWEIEAETLFISFLIFRRKLLIARFSSFSFQDDDDSRDDAIQSWTIARVHRVITLTFVD